MDRRQWQQWREDWDWIVDLMATKRFPVGPVEILDPISEQELRSIVDEVGTLPADFVDVVTNYSAGVRFAWDGCGLLEPPDNMRNTPDWGGGHPAGDRWVFNVRQLPALATYYNDLRLTFDWLPEAVAAFDDSVCFLQVGSRSAAVFKADGKVALISTDDTPTPIFVAENFVSFMTTWSQVGCLGPEMEGFQPFARGDVSVARWRAWIESSPPRTYVDPDEALLPCQCCGYQTVPKPGWTTCRVCFWYRQTDHRCSTPGCTTCGPEGSMLAEARAHFSLHGVALESHIGFALTPDELAAIPQGASAEANRD